MVPVAQTDDNKKRRLFRRIRARVSIVCIASVSFIHGSTWRITLSACRSCNVYEAEGTPQHGIRPLSYVPCPWFDGVCTGYHALLLVYTSPVERVSSARRSRRLPIGRGWSTAFSTAMTISLCNTSLKGTRTSPHPQKLQPMQLL